MNSKFHNKISNDPLHIFNEKEIFELFKRIEVKIRTIFFDILKNSDLLSAFVINRPELTFDYFHLLDQELLDEN